MSNITQRKTENQLTEMECGLQQLMAWNWERLS